MSVQEMRSRAQRESFAWDTNGFAGRFLKVGGTLNANRPPIWKSWADSNSLSLTAWSSRQKGASCSYLMHLHPMRESRVTRPPFPGGVPTRCFTETRQKLALCPAHTLDSFIGSCCDYVCAGQGRELLQRLEASFQLEHELTSHHSLFVRGQVPLLLSCCCKLHRCAARRMHAHPHAACKLAHANAYPPPQLTH